jgi:hypothetical protein
MFNSLLGHSSGGGNGRDKDTLPNVGGEVMFDKADAAGDFENELMLPPAAAAVTQQQEDKGLTLPPAAQMWGGDNHPHPHPHLNKLG